MSPRDIAGLDVDVDESFIRHCLHRGKNSVPIIVVHLREALMDHYKVTCSIPVMASKLSWLECCNGIAEGHRFESVKGYKNTFLPGLLFFSFSNFQLPLTPMTTDSICTVLASISS